MSGSRNTADHWFRSLRHPPRKPANWCQETKPMSTVQQEAGKIEQLKEHSADELEVVAGRERENLEGWIPALASDDEVREALEKAFDYRGDVTITKKDGAIIEGYIFDR